jgi:hypothetical protein
MGSLIVNDALAFDDGIEAIHSGHVYMFDGSAWPMNLNAVDFRRNSQTKVNAKIVRRGITATADHIAALPDATGCEIDGSSDCIPRTLRPANHFDPYPVILVSVHIPQQHWSAVELIDDNIDFAVIEEIAKSCAPRGENRSQAGSLHWWDEVKFPISEIVK